ncbi:MAG: hypothetical protein V1701_04130 [Planctomycetota bacterium]
MLLRLTAPKNPAIKQFIWVIVLSFVTVTSLLYALEDITMSASPNNSIVSVGSQGEFWIEFRNPYDRAWHNVKLTAESSHFQVKIIPEIIKEMKPNEELDVCIKVSLIKEAVAQTGVLSFLAEADEFGPKRFLGMSVVEGTNSAAKSPLPRGVFIIQIDRMIDYRTYICGGLIILLLIFFIRRKIKLGAK